MIGLVILLVTVGIVIFLTRNDKKKRADVFSEVEKNAVALANAVHRNGGLKKRRAH